MTRSATPGSQPCAKVESRKTNIAAVVDIREKPRRAMPVSQAAQRAGVPHPTVKGWLQRGLLRECGSEKYHAPGGRRILVDLDDVEYLRDHPPLNGRPPKFATN